MWFHVLRGLLLDWVGSQLYEGRSESNASYFIMLAHDVTGSRGWTFPLIVHKFCCRPTDSSRAAVWQNGGSYGSVYEAEVSFNFSMAAP
jgi:hypothetical protein